ncbi:MAG: STAS domain-containing protein [Cyanobacteria bacterium J06638_7]
MSTTSIEHEDLEDDLRRIRLSGRLDMVGVGEIEMRFTSLAASRPIRVLVDLTGVTFLASVGLRCIIHSAKALEQKGGRMVLLLADNTVVKGTLDTVGVSEIIPVRHDEAAAMDALAA